MAKRSAKKAKKSTKPSGGNEDAATWSWRPVLWLVLVGVFVFGVLSLWSFDASDWPSHAVAEANAEIQNWCGAIGAWSAYWMLRLVGEGVWVAFGALGVFLGLTLAGKTVTHPLVRAGGVAIVVFCISGLVNLWMPQLGSFPEGSGGVLAMAAVETLMAQLGAIGSALILLVGLAIGAVVAADRIVLALPRQMLAAAGLMRKVPVGRAVTAAAGLAGSAANLAMTRNGGGPSNADATHGEGTDDEQYSPRKKRSKRRDREAQDDENAIDPDAGGFAGTESLEQVEPKNKRRSKVKGEEAIDMDALREKVRKLPVNFANKPAAESEGEAPAEPLRREDYSGYQFPSYDLLADPEASFNETMEKYVRDQAESLEHALQVYGIEGEVVGIDSGPVITLYEVQLQPGTKVSSVQSISSDIARALRAQNIRIVPNIAGKTTIGIEVPNLKKEKVRVKELMTSSPDAGKMNLPMFLGKDASGTPLIADLSSMPHMLVAGTTGSGKSVCINTIILSFLYTKRPDELKLILVDPKMVEMSQFKEVPHLMCPVVTEMGKAAAILEWAVTKMEERYELFAEVGVRDIGNYNALEWEEIKERIGVKNEAEEARIPKKVPYIVFIIDELADLIMTHKEVETLIVRIAQKARAVGIHLILATQRPQANVVTGLIKSNMPCRVSFKVASGMDSRIVLDQKGAELLLGQGDMMYLGPRTGEVVRAQGTLVDDSEIRRVTRFLKDVASPSFERQLVTIRSAGSEASDPESGLSAADRDPLFLEAVDIIVESGRGSVSLLQRRLAIGYTRASRLIDQMGLAGIIGEHRGSVARDVIVTEEEWAQMRTMMEEGEASDTLFAPTNKDAVEVNGTAPVAVATIAPPRSENAAKPEAAWDDEDEDEDYDFSDDDEDLDEDEDDDDFDDDDDDEDDDDEEEDEDEEDDDEEEDDDDVEWEDDEDADDDLEYEEDDEELGDDEEEIEDDDDEAEDDDEDEDEDEDEEDEPVKKKGKGRGR